MENQKLVSPGKASSHVKTISGTVIVSPETGGAELAHPPKRTKLKEFSSAWMGSRICYDRDFGTLEVGCVRRFASIYFESIAQFDS